MAQAYQKKLDDLKQAFINADTDKKGRLTEAAFKEFVQIGFKKECPDGMYGYLCSHYQVDPSRGLTWETALKIWKESNPPPAQTKTPTKTPNGHKSKAASKNSSISSSPGSHARDKSLSSSMSSSMSSIHGRRSHRDNFPIIERRTTTEKDDASSMIVQMMEGRLKTLQATLKEERKKRKKADETIQQLLKTNEKFKQQLNEAETRCKKLERELKKTQDEAKKFKAMAEGDRNTVIQLRSQLKTEKSDSAEAFKLLRKMEEQHEQHVNKLKKKYATDSEKQSKQLLQTLGVDPSSGKDVCQLIRELKNEKRNLSNQVDLLNETLARKDRSLIHALQVVDDFSQMESNLPPSAHESKQDGDSSVPPKTKRQSFEDFKNVLQGLSKGGNKTGTSAANTSRLGQTKASGTKLKSPLPAPPVNKRK